MAVQMTKAETIGVFAKNSKGLTVLQNMRWGLLPASFTGFPESWEASTSHGKIETVAELPTFASAWAKKRRVIVPLDHITQKAVGSLVQGGRSKKKVRVVVRRADQRPLGVAGIYDYAHTASGPILSFAVLTRAPGPRMAELHDREPVVIEPELFQAWLDGVDDLNLEKPWADDAFVISAK